MNNAPHTNGSGLKAQPGRDANGRFAKGNPGGPGNPFARKVAALRKALINFVTVDDMKHVAFILKEKAMAGDLVAIKLLFQYVLGKPSETVNPDRLDIDECKLKEEHEDVVEGPAMLAEFYGRLGEAGQDEEDADDEPGELDDEPSPNGNDRDGHETGTGMGKLAQYIAQIIGRHAYADEGEAPSQNGENGADKEAAPSTIGGNGQHRKQERG